MKKIIHDGELVIIAEASAKGRRAYIEIDQSDKKRYVCDASGRIYSIDLESGQIHEMAPEVKDEQHKNPTIRINGKMHRIMDLIARVAFPGVKFENSQIGHLNGNPMDNAFWNLFISLKPKDTAKKDNIIERPKDR